MILGLAQTAIFNVEDAVDVAGWTGARRTAPHISTMALRSWAAARNSSITCSPCAESRARCRFVGEAEIRVFDERSTDGNALLFAAGHFRGPQVCLLAHAQKR